MTATEIINDTSWGRFLDFETEVLGRVEEEDWEDVSMEPIGSTCRPDERTLTSLSIRRVCRRIVSTSACDKGMRLGKAQISRQQP